MLPIFSDMDSLNTENPKEAIAQLIRHIKNLENQLYSFLTSLDGDNFSESITLDEIKVRRLTVEGGTAGKLSVGINKGTNTFEFVLVDKDGATQISY